MGDWLASFEDLFHEFITLAIHGLELMGVIIVLYGAVRAFFGYFFRHQPNIRLSLAQSMATGLEFKLGGEILRTVIARDWNEILTVGAIILLRALLNFLIHWEISHIQQDAEIIEHAAAHPELRPERAAAEPDQPDPQSKPPRAYRPGALFRPADTGSGEKRSPLQ